MIQVSTSFGMELCRKIDSMYLRPPASDNPVWRLINDDLPIDEAKAFFLGMRDSLEVFNRVLLPRLIEAAPTPQLRKTVLPVVAVEYGPGLSRAHPTLFERFLVALGVGSNRLGPSGDIEITCREEIAEIRGLSWCGLLGRILVGESLGPVVFPAIAAALQRNYGLTAHDTHYFSLHATHDKRDTEILLGLLEGQAKTESQRLEVLRTIERSFAQGRYKQYACKLFDATHYRFQDEYRADTSKAMGSLADKAGARGEDDAMGSMRLMESEMESEIDLQHAALPQWLAACWAECESELTSPRTRVGAMLCHRISAADAAQSWRELAPVFVARETLFATRVIEQCPDLETRVALWATVAPQFGADESSPAQTERLQRFLLDFDPNGFDQSVTNQHADKGFGPNLAGADFRWLLAVGVFAPLLVDLFVFPAMRRALRSQTYPCRNTALAFFDRAIEAAASALPLIAGIATRYFDSEELRHIGSETVKAYLRAFMDANDPYRAAMEQGRALSPQEFEDELRALCDAAYAGQGDRENPVVKLLQGALTIEEARRFWSGRWNRGLLLTQCTLPSMLRRSPDLESSIVLFRSIQVEYGCGEPERAHPMLYRRFLIALGCREEEFSLRFPSDDPDHQRELMRLEQLDWHRLIGEFLARETVGPKSFTAVASALKRQFDLSDEDVAWFTVHSEQDLSDADDLFALARKFGRTRLEQRKIRDAMLGWFQRNPWYCCNLDTERVQREAEKVDFGGVSATVTVASTDAPMFRELCVNCGKEFDRRTFNTKCDHCGGLIDIVYDLAKVKIYNDERESILRYSDLIPVHDKDGLVRIGAGNTPCVHAKSLGRLLGLHNLFLKDETKNPTCTVKDRPAEVVLSYLKERGIFHFTSSATGNSSTAFAQACIATPPFEHSIFVGERWLERLTFPEHPRVHVWVMEGAKTSVEAITQSRAWEKANGIPSEGGFFNPGRREGLKLAFLEAVDQLRTSFDWYVQGVSTAMGAYGAYQGALQYYGLGRIDRIPKMALAQEATCCPQVNAFGDRSAEVQPHHIVKNPDGIADALLKGNPSDTYPYIYRMMQKAGGTFTSVTAEEIAAARRDIYEHEGIEACNASSTTIAAIRKLVRCGRMKASDRVLVVITGKDRDFTKHVRAYTRLVRGENGEWLPATVEHATIASEQET